MPQASQNKLKASTAPAEPMLVWLGLTERHSAVFLVLLATLLVSGLAVVAATHESRYEFNRLQELRSEASELNVEWGQLLIEQSTFGVEGRIEQKAIEQLDMHVPDVSQIVMIAQ